MSREVCSIYHFYVCVYNSVLITTEWFRGRRRITKMIRRQTNWQANQLWCASNPNGRLSKCLCSCLRAYVYACQHIAASTCEQRNSNELINKLLPHFVCCFVIFPWLFDSSDLLRSLCVCVCDSSSVFVSPYLINTSTLEQHKLCCRCALHVPYALSNR